MRQAPVPRFRRVWRHERPPWRRFSVSGSLLNTVVLVRFGALAGLAPVRAQDSRLRATNL
jgi:hypothetical protein